MNINGQTKIYGIFGYPISHTLSPAMQNAAFEKLKINAVYLPFEVRPDRIKDAINSLFSLGISGVNLTMPYKEICLPYLNDVSKEAKLIGAVNTIAVNEDGRLKGYNTDGIGFVAALKRQLRIDPKGRSVFILGAGGAGKAVAIQLALEGARHIFIADIQKNRAQKLVINLRRNVHHLRVKAVPCVGKEIERAIADTDILINATPMGMKESDSMIFDLHALHNKIVVCDLIYSPPMTKLLKIAKQKKLRYMNGLGMLLYQGATAFGLWTQKQAPVDVMQKALEKEIASSKH